MFSVNTDTNPLYTDTFHNDASVKIKNVSFALSCLVHIIFHTNQRILICVDCSFHLKRAITTIKARVEVVDLASHGFMSKMLDIILFVFERCLDNQMSGRLIY